jgi:hypothetical protein
MRLLNAINNRISETMTDPASRISATSNKPRAIEAQDDMTLYYSCFPGFGVLESRTIYSAKGILYDSVNEYLGKGWELIRSQKSYNIDHDKEFYTWQCWVNEKGLMCTLYISAGEDEYDNMKVSSYERLIADLESDNIPGEVRVIDDMRIFVPVIMIGKDTVEDIWNELKEVCKGSPVPKNTKPKVGIISHDGREFYVKNFSLEGKTPEFNFPDLHYGEGFEDFHNKLLLRLNEETKGLVLLHGEPGTGKTQYIRILLDRLGAIGKSVLYVPPSFSTQLTEPNMIEFISSWIVDEDKDCILLIEDAEPLLEVRGNDGRTTGISNLLNITDGLLNDILGLTVIATFNTEISKIDPAVLRPSRLIARKEFGKISELTAYELSKALDMPVPDDIEYPATLAEFYTSKKAKNVLIHQVNENKPNRIGFGS